jgi:hypothetical protein
MLVYEYICLSIRDTRVIAGAEFQKFKKKLRRTYLIAVERPCGKG